MIPRLSITLVSLVLMIILENDLCFRVANQVYQNPFFLAGLNILGSHDTFMCSSKAVDLLVTSMVVTCSDRIVLLEVSSGRFTKESM
jgi:hypothetical protein